MAESNPQHQRQLGTFIKALLAGTAEVGISALPILVLYKQAKASSDWKQIGLTEWVTTDPKAAEILAKVLEEVKDKLPVKVRNTMIAALGGLPLEE